MPRYSTSIVSGVAIAVALLSGCTDRQSSEREEAIKTEWVDLQNDLKRRNELALEIVDVIRRSGTHESPALQAVADSHARLAAAQTPEETLSAANQQWAALGSLSAAVENDPQLKGNEAFTQLMEELKGAEIRISVGRMRYNAQVQQYRMGRQGFFGALKAIVVRAENYPFFELPPK